MSNSVSKDNDHTHGSLFLFLKKKKKKKKKKKEDSYHKGNAHQLIGSFWAFGCFIGIIMEAIFVNFSSNFKSAQVKS